MKIALILVALASAAAQDAPKHHSVALESSREEFTIRMGGMLDGESTRDPVVYNAWKQGFEPMRSVKLENLGETVVVNPWITVNGRGDWRTTKNIADEAVRAFGDPAQMTAAEKARAIWEFQRRHRFHATTGDFEVRDPVKMFNVYGYSLCGDNASVLADLWRTQGFPVRRGFPTGHCVSEVWYDGAWHLLDADESILFLDRDNVNVSSENAVAHDKDLARRFYTGDVLPALYAFDGRHDGEYPSHEEHTMAFKLRPGEAIEWRWDNAGRHHHGPLPSLYTLNSTELKRWGEQAWAALSNGKWTYTPRIGAGQEQSWQVQTPYVIVGGKLRVRTHGVVALRASLDGEHWSEVGRVDGTRDVNLDSLFANHGRAVYEYNLEAEAAPGGKLEALTIENDLQMARLSLPALRLGENRIAYYDETEGSRSVRLTFDWVERSGVTVLPAPSAPRFPLDRGEVEGLRFALEWAAVPGAAEYHFQLGDDPALRWALTPSFDERVKVSTRFSIEREGLLTPGRRYYWHVRARSESGVWGPWSKTWSFAPRGPGVPLKVRVEPDRPDGYTLRWNPGDGSRAVSYRVYASNEKGFSISDEPYRVAVGNQKNRGLFPGERFRTFPANLLATTKNTSLELTLEHAYYRVVAIDEKGNRSGPSDYAAGPRPYIYSRPPVTARVGQPFRYEVKTVSSIGDLTFRDFGPGQPYQSAFWDADQPVFSIEPEMPRCGNFDPSWLHIDAKTGLLEGTPPDSGDYQINVKVEIPRAGTHIQSFPLRIAK